MEMEEILLKLLLRLDKLEKEISELKKEKESEELKEEKRKAIFHSLSATIEAHERRKRAVREKVKPYLSKAAEAAIQHFLAEPPMRIPEAKTPEEEE